MKNYISISLFILVTTSALVGAVCRDIIVELLVDSSILFGTVGMLLWVWIMVLSIIGQENKDSKELFKFLYFAMFVIIIVGFIKSDINAYFNGATQILGGTVYEWEGVQEQIGWDIIAFGMILPILPVSIVYIIYYVVHIIVLKIKLKDKKGNEK